jgi:hypothetical protein
MLNRQDSVPRSDGGPADISITFGNSRIYGGEIVVWTIQRDWTQNNPEHVGHRRAGFGRT